ncbi:MAG: hypothetical protein NVSMB47_02960 [Polyangiales bacterium]
MHPHRPLATALAAVLVLASATPARAQTVSAQPPLRPNALAAPTGYGSLPLVYVPLVPLWLESDEEGSTYEVLGARGDDRIYGRCFSPCRLELPVGAYRVRSESMTAPSKERTLLLGGPTRVYSEAGSKSGRAGGLALAIVGTAFAGGGLIVALGARMSTTCWIECGGGGSNSASRQREVDDARTTANVALVVAGVGALVGTIGWVTFASSSTKIHVESGHGAQRFSFGVAPLLGGATLGLTGTF